MNSAQVSVVDLNLALRGEYDRWFFPHWYFGVIGGIENQTGLRIKRGSTQINHTTFTLTFPFENK